MKKEKIGKLMVLAIIFAVAFGCTNQKIRPPENLQILSQDERFSIKYGVEIWDDEAFIFCITAILENDKMRFIDMKKRHNFSGGAKILIVSFAFLADERKIEVDASIRSEFDEEEIGYWVDAEPGNISTVLIDLPLDPSMGLVEVDLKVILEGKTIKIGKIVYQVANKI